MKQKEYDLLADWLKFCNQEGWTDHAELMAEELADKLEYEYPRTFDRDNFLKACGVTA